MRTVFAIVLALALGSGLTQTKSTVSRPKSKSNLTQAYVDQANDALEAVDRLFEIQDEARLIFIPARLEAEKYIAKAGRLAFTPDESAAHQALREYYGELFICRVLTEASGKVTDSCKGGPVDPRRIKAFAAINGRPLPVD
jgi:hypothetical protein